MYTTNEYVIQRIHKDAYNRAYQEAEKLRALRRAGLLKPSLLSRISYRGMGCLGRLLVAVGQRLEQAEASANQAFRSPAGLEST